MQDAVDAVKAFCVCDVGPGIRTWLTCKCALWSDYASNAVLFLSARQWANLLAALASKAGISALCECERVEPVGRYCARCHPRQLGRRQQPEIHQHHELRSGMVASLRVNVRVWIRIKVRFRVHRVRAEHRTHVC